MFTGLVAELGTVRGLKRVQNSYHLTVAARKVLDNLKICVICAAATGSIWKGRCG